MTTQSAIEDVRVSQQLRPIVVLVAVVALAVASLLIATASLGASPINSMQVASLS